MWCNADAAAPTCSDCRGVGKREGRLRSVEGGGSLEVPAHFVFLIARIWQVSLGLSKPRFRAVYAGGEESSVRV